MKLAKLESIEATGCTPSWRSLVYSSSETYRGPAWVLEDDLHPSSVLALKFWVRWPLAQNVPR